MCWTPLARPAAQRRRDSGADHRAANRHAARSEILDKGECAGAARDTFVSRDTVAAAWGSRRGAMVLLKGRGVALPDPIDAAGLIVPVTAQLVNADSGLCWENTFSAPTKNTTSQFKAKTP